MIDPLFALVISSGLGLLFVVAGAHKLTHREDFRAALRGYLMVPRAVTGGLTLFVPILEIAGGILVLIRPLTDFVPGLWLVTLLLAVYAAAISLNIKAGRVHIDCGCLGFSAKRDRLSWGMVARNAVLALLAVSAASALSPRELAILDWISLPLAIAVAALLYAAFDTLLLSPLAEHSR